MTLRRLRGETVIPVATAWSLAALGEARGRQELYTRQSPQRLKARVPALGGPLSGLRAVTTIECTSSR